MTPTEIREALRALVDEVDSFAEHRDSSAQTCLGFALEDARPALAAIAGKVWLDVETVRTLIDATQDFRDSFERETGLVATNSRAALAAAEAELRAIAEVM